MFTNAQGYDCMVGRARGPSGRVWSISSLPTWVGTKEGTRAAWA